MSWSLVVTAQTYPQNEITIVNPTITGSTTWVLLNKITTSISANREIKFKILDKPGADKMLGANFSSEMTANGYTLHAGAASDMVLLPLIQPTGIKYTINSFIPVASLSTQDPFLIVPANFPANNLKELLELIQKDPKICSIGNSGMLPKLVANKFCNVAGVSLNDIPYSGDNKIVVDVAGGHLPIGIVTLTSARSALFDGKIKLIASFGRNRSSDFLKVGTVNEVYPGFIEQWWIGIFAPIGTPPDVLMFLNSEFNKALSNPKLIEELSTIGYTVEPMNLSQVTQYYQTLIKKYEPLALKHLK